MSSMLQTSDTGGVSRTSKALIALVILLTLGGIFLVTRHSPAAPASLKTSDPQAPLELAQADVATVMVRPLSRELPLSGSVQPVNQATLKSKVSGEVLEMTVREGQIVHRGEILARVDVRLASANKDNSQAAVEKARADLAIAKLNYDNSVKLLDQKFISQNAVDSSKATYEASLATLKAMDANLRLSSISLEDATVRAPFDGVISKREVQVGEKVSPDSSIFTIVDLSQMELDAPAPASEVPAIKVGQIAHFQVDGFADREFEGKVWRINPIAESGSRSIYIYLSVPNVDGALKGGMFAQGELKLDAGAAVPTVPIAATHDDAGAAYVWVVRDGAVMRRNVTLGLKSPADGLIEVKDGVQAGEQIVVAKIDGLKDGTNVKLARAGTSRPTSTADAASGPSASPATDH